MIVLVLSISKFLPKIDNYESLLLSKKRFTKISIAIVNTQKKLNGNHPATLHMNI